MASGTFASFSTTSARISCSRATAMARRFSASALARRMSASAWAAWSWAPTFSPTSTSAISIERISNAVPASRPLCQHRLGDPVRVLQHALVGDRAADGRDDALADAGDDRLLRGAADQPLDVRPDRHAGLGPELNAVLGHGVDGLLALFRIGAVDHLRIDAGLNRVEDIASGQVDGRGRLERQIDVGAVGGDERPHDVRHPPPCQVVAFQVVRRQLQARPARR